MTIGQKAQDQFDWTRSLMNRVEAIDVKDLTSYGSQFIADVVTPEPHFSKEKSEERAGQRKILIEGIDDIMTKYDYNAEHPNWKTEQGLKDQEQIKSWQDALSDKLELTFDELEYDPTFIANARKMFQAEHGYEFSGNDRGLANETFKRFNALEQNIGWTGAKLLLDNMFWRDFDPESLEATSAAYKTFSGTPWLGDGSRDFGTQATEFAINTGLDPAMYGTGYTTGWLAKGARILGQKAFRKQIADHMAGTIGVSAYTGTLGGIHGSNIEQIKQDLGLTDHISGAHIATSAGLGALFPWGIKGVGKAGVWLSEKVDEKFGHTLPILRRDLSSYMRNIFAAAKHPWETGYGRQGFRYQIASDDAKMLAALESTEGGTVKGTHAAAIGLIKDIEGKITASATKTAPEDFYRALSDDVIAPMNEKVQWGYNNLTYNELGATKQNILFDKILAMLEKQQSNPNFKIRGDVLEQLEVIFGKEQIHKYYDFRNNAIKDEFTGFGSFETASFDDVYHKALPADKVDSVLKQLKSSIFLEEQAAYRGNDPHSTAAFKDFYQLIRATQKDQLATKGDKMAWDALQASTRDFKTALKNTQIGREFAEILQFNKLANVARSYRTSEGKFDPSTGNAEAFDLEAERAASKLLDRIINSKSSLRELKSFQSILKNIDKRTQNVINANVNTQSAKLESEMHQAYFAKTQENQSAFPELEALRKTISDAKVKYQEDLNIYRGELEKAQIEMLGLSGKELAAVKLPTEPKLITDKWIEDTKNAYIKSYAERLAKMNNASFPSSYDTLLDIVKSGLGFKLRSEGLESVTKILDRPDGFDLIKHMYPAMEDDLARIESLRVYLEKRVQPKHSQSVIVNMTFARLAQEGGAFIGGSGVQAASVLTTFNFLQRYRNLLSNTHFQRAMADTLLNKGRVPTKTQFKLEKFLKFDQKGIQSFQDDLANMMTVMPLIKNEQNLKEQAKRMLQ